MKVILCVIKGRGCLQVEFNAREALNIARSLSFPRAVGSAGEEAAASMIEKKLFDAGYLPQREEFFIPLTPWGTMKGFVLFAILILLGARGLAFLYPMISGFMNLSIVFFLVFYPSIWSKFVGSKTIFRWLIGRKRKGQSLLELPQRRKNLRREANLQGSKDKEGGLRPPS